MSIRRKFLLAFSVPAALACSLAFSGFRGIAASGDLVVRLYGGPTDQDQSCLFGGCGTERRPSADNARSRCFNRDGANDPAESHSGICRDIADVDDDESLTSYLM
jgi:hypothetical protein